MVVTREDELLGFATSRPEFSTWDAAYYLHLNCLCLRPELRGRSVSRRVVSAIGHEAPRPGRERIQWQTPVFNTNAIALYRRLGATKRTRCASIWTITKRSMARPETTDRAKDG